MSPTQTARLAYADHVVRRSCCTGGRLCPTGRVLTAEALVEERRLSYTSLAGIGSRHFGLELEARSVALDCAMAAASDERLRGSVPW